jgi:hypothetical protein
MFVVLALVRHYNNGLIFHVENAASSVTVFFFGYLSPLRPLSVSSNVGRGP